MPIPTEPIGSIPRPPELILGVEAFNAGRLSREALNTLYDRAVRDTIERFEATGSPVITDGEQTKPSFATYPIDGLPHLAPDGVTITFADRHTRQLPRLTAGPFRYRTYADTYLVAARKYARVPVKQAVIAASADLFRLEVGNFYIPLASERNRRRVLSLIKAHAKRDQRVFVGVIDPINPKVETPEEVRDRILEAVEYITPDRLGTTDDCGFSPFGDDVSTKRKTAFEKIRARVAGTALAAGVLGR